MANNERYRVRRVTDGKYLSVGRSSDNRASLMWDRSYTAVDVWTREQAQCMARVASLIWGGLMSLEIEPATEGGNDAATR